MKTDLDICIAIATYNGEKYLQSQLDSIASQSLQPHSISISDDASSDMTVSIIREFGKRFKGEIYIRENTKNVGVISNFMFAFQGCSGRFIAYCDQDDVWRHDKLARCVESLGNYPNAALIYHRSTITDHNLNSNQRYEPANISGGLYAFPHFPDYIWGYGHQMIFSREVYIVLKGILGVVDGPLSTVGRNLDVAILLAASMVGDIIFLDEELVKFRRHPGTVSPAAKVGNQTASKTAKIANRRERVDYVINLLNAFDQAPELSNWVANAEKETAYRARLKVLLDCYRQRQLLYKMPDLRSRAATFAHLINMRAYGRGFENRLPMRQFLADFQRCVACK